MARLHVCFSIAIQNNFQFLLFLGLTEQKLYDENELYPGKYCSKVYRNLTIKSSYVDVPMCCSAWFLSNVRLEAVIFQSHGSEPEKGYCVLCTKVQHNGPKTWFDQETWIVVN